MEKKTAKQLFISLKKKQTLYGKYIIYMYLLGKFPHSFLRNFQQYILNIILSAIAFNRRLLQR